MTTSKYIFILFIISSFSACDLDRLNLEEEFLPNYSITIDSKFVSESTNSDLIALNDEEYLMAIETELSEIELMQYNQLFENDSWDVCDGVQWTESILKYLPFK